MRPAEKHGQRGEAVADLEGLVCSSMASTALSTELSSDWVWLAVSFSRKRVTNWSTLLPLSYTCVQEQRSDVQLGLVGITDKLTHVR